MKPRGRWRKGEELESPLALIIAGFGHCADRKVSPSWKSLGQEGLLCCLNVVPLQDVGAKEKQCAYERDKVDRNFPVSAPVLSYPSVISAAASGCWSGSPLRWSPRERGTMGECSYDD